MFVGMCVFSPPDYGLKSALGSRWMEVVAAADDPTGLYEIGQGV